jgi:hypothetical protein
MSRIVHILVAFLTPLAVVATTLVVVKGTPSARIGLALYGHREVLRQAARAESGPSAAVAWLGDSTVMETATIPSYPTMIDEEKLRPLGLRSIHFAETGFDFYAYHSLVDDALDLGPRVVVLIANLRVCIPEGGARGFNDLTGELPLGRLPRMLTLPYSFRGMTAPRLVLVRLLRPAWGEEGFLIAEGARSLFQEQPFWSRLGPTEPRVLTKWEIFRKGRDRVLGDYRYPVRPGHPLIRFAAATVADAVARGARVLVVITPAPVDRLKALGWYDADDFARRAAVIRAAVEGAGGTLLDLHDALPTELFRDPGGHFTKEGAARMDELVWPALAHELGVPAPGRR